MIKDFPIYEQITQPHHFNHLSTFYDIICDNKQTKFLIPFAFIFFFFHFKLYSIFLILSLNQDLRSLRFYFSKLSLQILQFFWVLLGVQALKINCSEHVVRRQWPRDVEPCLEYFEIVNKELYFTENMQDIYFDINQVSTLLHPQE